MMYLIIALAASSIGLVIYVFKSRRLKAKLEWERKRSSSAWGTVRRLEDSMKESEQGRLILRLQEQLGDLQTENEDIRTRAAKGGVTWVDGDPVPFPGVTL